jgi:hypothetical protein
MRWPKLVGGPHGEPYWIYALAGALLGGGPVWHYLYVERYPPLLDFLLLVGGAALAGAAIAMVARALGGLLEAVVFGALIYAFQDLQFDLHLYLRAPVLLAIGVGLSLLLRRHRATITCVTLGAFYLAALPRSGPAVRVAGAGTAGTPVGHAGLPMLVHIVLDEQWGIGGLRLEGDSATATFLTDFYLRRGFDVFPAAYSRIPYTEEALPLLVSLGARPTRALMADTLEARRDHFTRRVRANPYFEALRARGYAIRVFQNRFMDFCAAPASPVASCESEAANSIANIAYAEGSPVTRAVLAGRYLLSLKSHAFAVLYPTPAEWRRSSVGSGLAALRRLRAAIASGPRGGVAYFVHALAPHRPIEVDAACRVLADPAQRIGYTQPTHLSDAVWSRWMARMGGQIRCTHRELDAVLDAVDARAGPGGAVVIVHGDHGSRLFQHDPKDAPLATLDDRQLGGRYSTLLATRRPGVPGRVVRDPVPVQDFVWRLARQDFRGTVPLGFRQYVISRWPGDTSTDTLRTLSPGTMPWER